MRGAGGSPISYWFHWSRISVQIRIAVVVREANSRRLRATWCSAAVPKYSKEAAATVWRRYDQRGDVCAVESMTVRIGVSFFVEVFHFL